jgi:hypothetical protein
MGVGIDESRQDDFAGAIDFDEAITVLLDPRVTRCFSSSTDRSDSSSNAKHSGVFDDSQFPNRIATPRP